MKISRILALTLPLIVAMLLPSALCPLAVQGQQSEGSISGIVKDQNGDAVSGAEVKLLHPQQAVLRTTTTDSSGRFKFEGVQRGSYEIRINQAGFAPHRVSVLLSAGDAELFATLAVAPLADQTTVTADTGQAQEKDRVPQALNIISEGAIQQRTTAVGSAVNLWCWPFGFCGRAAFWIGYAP